VGEERARGVELLAVQDVAVAPPRHAGADVEHRLGADLGEGVAEAGAAQDEVEEEPLLPLRPVEPQRLDHVEVVLRDLADARVGLRDDLDHLGERDVGDEGAAVLARDGDAPEAALREALDLRLRQGALLVALGGTARELGGELLGNGHRLGVVADDVGQGRALVGGARGARPHARRNLGERDRGHGWSRAVD
jgi:hypothetical protein